MAVTPLTPSLIDYLLSCADGFRFEQLIKDLLAIRDGDAFVPLGGTGDGGADGFFRSTYESKDRPGHFVQISKEENVSNKIRGTVKRLREVKRAVTHLTFWSGRSLPRLDQLEEALSDELGIVVWIRDQNALGTLINHQDKTRAHFQIAFRSEILELSAQQGDLAQKKPSFATDPSVFVFLQFENAERFQKGGLAIPVVDALIYWSLRETDPDTGHLMSRSDIKKRIAELLPGAQANLLPHVDDRLIELSKKSPEGFQRVRHYVKEDSFCLPFEMRLQLASEGAHEALLRESVIASLVNRARRLGAKNPDVIAEVCEKAIYRHFNEQGLILAAFLEKRLEDITVAEQIVETELQSVANSGKLVDQKSYSIALAVLREVFYTPNESEDDFLKRLSRTSLLLFSLKHCPQLIEYFNQLTGNFRLLIGSDLIIKALSETFLPPQFRHVTNLLAITKACGANLILTEPAFNEIFTHMHAAHLEFRNHYSQHEAYITPALASQCDRIIIRTYFYARIFAKQVKGWRAFIDQFVDLKELEAKSVKGQAQLQAYLCKRFGLDFVPKEEIIAGIDQHELQSLAAALVQRHVEKNEILAHNDALMVLAVYAQRHLHKEAQKYDGLGLRTWWLTKEVHVLTYTVDVVRKYGGIPYIMRPEFLLNFLTNSPKAREIKGELQQLIPSHVGLQIGQHLPKHHMHRILAEFDNWHDLPVERVEIKMSDAVDHLKFDRLKRYESNLDVYSDADPDQLISALKEAGKSRAS